MKNTDLTERVLREKHAHDEDDVLGESLRLKGKFSHVTCSPTMRRLDSDFESILRNVDGKDILEVGCGFGELSIALAERNARVLGIDISDSYVEMAKKNANLSSGKDRCGFRTMDAHDLKLADESMDIVVGRAILHHLSIQDALFEIRRVLRPGGRMVFMEPLAANPLLKLFRLLTPRARTADERPLTIADLRAFEKDWLVHSSYYGLISAPVAMLTSLVMPSHPDNGLLRMADRIEVVVNRVSVIQPFNQYVLLNLIRSA